MTRETLDKIESVVTMLIGISGIAGAAYWQEFSAEFLGWAFAGYTLFKGLIERQKSRAVTEKTDGLK